MGHAWIKIPDKATLLFSWHFLASMLLPLSWRHVHIQNIWAHVSHQKLHTLHVVAFWFYNIKTIFCISLEYICKKYYFTHVSKNNWDRSQVFYKVLFSIASLYAVFNIFSNISSYNSFISHQYPITNMFIIFKHLSQSQTIKTNHFPLEYEIRNWKSLRNFYSSGVKK